MIVRTFLINSVASLPDSLKLHTKDGFMPTLAIVFSSVALDIPTLIQPFDELDIEVFGCTSAGEIMDNEVSEQSASIMLLDINKSYFKLHFAKTTPEKSTFDISKEAALYAKEHFENPAILVGAGGLAIDAEQIVFGIKSVLPDEMPLFGGSAGDDLAMQRTFVFNSKDFTDNGNVCLIFDADKIEVQGLATSGWETLGTMNTITKSEGNVVYTINDEPALELFIKYFGFYDNTGTQGELVSTISAQYPLQILREGAEPILRSPIIGDETANSLTLAGGVKQGDKFKFSISPGFEVIDKTIEEYGEFSKDIPNVDALVLFSCKGRHTALGPMIEDEIEGIYRFWNTPLVGYFCYGEIGHTKTGTCEFHNQTCVLVALKEKI